VIDENNYFDYKPGNVENSIDNSIDETLQDKYRSYPEISEEKQENEVLGIPNETLEIVYDGSQDPNTGEILDQQKQVYDGIDNNEVISFDYTDRHGRNAGRRIVEPYYTFIARTTGNEILVTFDKTKNDIRAFIVGNIHPYGVRYEDVQFEPKSEIMKGVY